MVLSILMKALLSAYKKVASFGIQPRLVMLYLFLRAVLSTKSVRSSLLSMNSLNSHSINEVTVRFLVSHFT